MTSRCLLSLALLASACVGSQVMKGESRLLVTDALQIVGYGEGSTPPQARQRATLDVASQLIASLRSQYRSVTVELSEQSAGKETSLYRSETIDHFQVDTEFDHPEWIEVVALTQIEDHFRATVRLSRKDAKRALDALIRQGTKTLAAVLEVAPDDPTRPALLASARKRFHTLSRQLLLRNAVVQRVLPLPPAYEAFDQMNRQVLAQGPQTSLRLCWSGPPSAIPADELRPVLAAALHKRTKSLRRCKEQGGWVLNIQLEANVTTSMQLPGVSFCTVSLSAGLVAPDNREVWSVANLGGRQTKSGQRTALGACRAAMETAAKELIDMIRLDKHE